MLPLTLFLTSCQRAAVLFVTAAALVACSTTPPVPAPVVNKSPARSPSKELAGSVAKAPAPVRATPLPAVQGTFLRPALGPTIAVFDGLRNKGIDIGGKLGDPVLAAADGRVVYAGSRLRGYGNLVFIKHGVTFLTAYAHNRVLLVRENEVVRQGQKIAEMGRTETDRVKLHFELRKHGEAVNPEPYLRLR